ncbi:hypothetical protein [Anabaena lutea]|nr:hypothetical protein [Anabaena lutea]
MTDTSTHNQDNLTNISKILWDKVLKPDNSWKDNPKCSEIQQRLSYFNPNHLDTPEHIDKVIKCVIRGVRLTEEAINWYEPSIGGEKLTVYDKLRGVQWRLVIAYIGFEITTKALMNNFGGVLPSNVIIKFIKQSNLPSYNPLIPPNPKKKENLDKWLAKDEDAIAEFLGVISPKDKQLIKHWIVQSNSISSWEEAVQLARFFRNASAHGFLSAKKVQDWELKPGLSILADNLGEIMAAGLKKLI